MLAVKMRNLFLKCTVPLEKYLPTLVAAAEMFSHFEINSLLKMGKGRWKGTGTMNVTEANYRVLWSIEHLFLVEQKDKEGFSKKVIDKTTKG